MSRQSLPVRLAALTLLALLVSGCAYVPPQQTFDSPLASDEEKQIRIGPPIIYSSEPPSGGVTIPRFAGEPVASLAAAQDRLDFPLLAPTALPEGFDLAWVATEGPTILRLVYSDGERYIHIVQSPSAGYNIPDENTPLSPPFEHLVINDRPAMGHDRGVRFTPWFGPSLMVSPGYAYLTWWPEGLAVSLWPEDASITLADLTAIAESMQPLEQADEGG